MWAYQIEMRPMLFAIEFFFIAVTMFLSPVRYNRDHGARNAARIGAGDSDRWPPDRATL